MPPFERNGRAARRPVFEVTVPEHRAILHTRAYAQGHGSTSSLPLDFDPFVFNTSSQRSLGGSRGPDQKERVFKYTRVTASVRACAR